MGTAGRWLLRGNGRSRSLEIEALHRLVKQACRDRRYSRSVGFAASVGAIFSLGLIPSAHRRLRRCDVLVCR